MGISQHVHGTDNARCLISLALMTGNVGRQGTGLHPLRGQNNVQGASDAGLIPMMYPDYQLVEKDNNKEFYEKLQGQLLIPACISFFLTLERNYARFFLSQLFFFAKKYILENSSCFPLVFEKLCSEFSIRRKYRQKWILQTSI